jgi:hypothetical protein
MEHHGRHRPSPRSIAALVGLAAGVVFFTGSVPAFAAVTQAQCTISLVDDAYSTAPDTALTVPNPGVVSNDEICGTDGLVISVTPPTHGTLSNFDDDDGGFTYTPLAGFVGTDSFTYRLEDVAQSPIATVTITVASATTTTESTTTTTVATTTSAAGSSPTSTTPTTSGSLVRTGSHSGPMVAAGSALIISGLALTLLADRRRRLAG